MNKKTLIKTKYPSINAVKPLLASFILVVGLSLVVVTSWTGPISTPVNDNTAAPIDAVTDNQEKLGYITVASLINTGHGPFVTYSPLIVGVGNKPSSTFYGKVNLLKIINTSASTDQHLCTSSIGTARVCTGGVSLDPVQDVYYTQTLTNSQTISWPGTVTGQVKYDIATGVTCTTEATAGTNWGNGTTLTGSNSAYNVTFSNWGRYYLVMNCDNNSTHTAVIDIKGKIQPPVGSLKQFLFTSSRQIEVKAQGGGAAAINSSYCEGEADGWPAYVHVTNTSSWTPNSTSGAKGSTYDSGANLALAGGGHGYSVKDLVDGKIYPSGTNMGTAGKNHAYSCFGGGGGDNLMMYGGNITKTVGGSPSSGGNGGSSGGCPGSSPASCNLTEPGSGGYGNYGGGGGGYVSGTYTMPANYYLYVYASASPVSSSNTGKPADVTIEWK